MSVAIVPIISRFVLTSFSIVIRSKFPLPDMLISPILSTFNSLTLASIITFSAPSLKVIDEIALELSDSMVELREILISLIIDVPLFSIKE